MIIESRLTNDQNIFSLIAQKIMNKILNYKSFILNGSKYYKHLQILNRNIKRFYSCDNENTLIETFIEAVKIILDLDYFKNINDSFGHDAGDEVLRTVSNELQKSIRSSDTICRFGGEEFLLILPDIDSETCIKRAEIIKNRIEQLQIKASENEIKVTVSIGVSVFEYQEDFIENTIKKADKALYEAKQNGRNQVIFK